MSVYLDASVLVSFFVDDSLSARADRFIENAVGEVLIVSDFAVAEFSAVIGRKVRTGELGSDDAAVVLANLDAWSAKVAEHAETTAQDTALAIGFLRRTELSLRAPDAINIAIVQRLRATLATFDERMARDAAALGVATAEA